MIALLGRIAATLGASATSVTAGIMAAVNLIIGGIATAIAGLLGLLPNLPPVPSNPAPEATGWIAYFIPAQFLVTFALALVAMFALFQLMKTVMNWVKAL